MAPGSHELYQSWKKRSAHHATTKKNLNNLHSKKKSVAILLWPSYSSCPELTIPQLPTESHLPRSPKGWGSKNPAAPCRMILEKKYLLEKVPLVLWCLVVESEVQSSWQLLFGHLRWLDCFRFFHFLGFQMTYDWPKPPQDGLLNEGHKNPSPVPRWSQGKTSSKAWGQRMASMPATKCIKQFWYCMLYPHVAHINAHIIKIIHIIHVCIYTYIHISCHIAIFMVSLWKAYLSS